MHFKPVDVVGLNVIWLAYGFSPGLPATTYAVCQSDTCPPTAGCPDGTIFVSQNDTQASFTRIQAAIDSLGNDTRPGFILIGPGTYNEQLNVTRQAPLTLLGMSPRPQYAAVDVNSSSSSSSSSASNAVQVRWDSANHNASLSDNLYSGVLTVGSTLDATLTGSGPTGFGVPANTPLGCQDFRAYNMDFRNEFAPYAAGPSHAVGVSGTNAAFYSCGLYSWQDTLYVGKLGNAFFYDSIIAGEVDFLYGFGTAYIEKSTLSLRSCGGGIAAWKGSNTTTFANKYGVYIDRSQVIAANATVAAQMQGRCSLGRPWNDGHRSVFMETYLDASIKPEGYSVWSPTDARVTASTFMATWNNSGPGCNETAERLGNITRVLQPDEVAPYRNPVDVFMRPDGSQPYVGWIDSSVLSDS